MNLTTSDAIALLTLLLTAPFIPKLYRKIRGVFRLHKKVLGMVEQFQPNGGSSVVDKLDSLVQGQKLMMGNVDHLTRKLDGLAASTEILGLLSDTAQFESDSSGRWIAVNQALVDLFGSSAQELLGLGWLNSLDPDAVAVEQEAWGIFVASGHEITRYVWLNCQETSTRFRVSYHAIARRSVDGLPVKIYGAFTKVEAK